MEPIRIEVKHFDLEFERNMETQESFIELHDNYLQYKAIYDSEIPVDKEDLMQGWKPMFYDFDLRIKREHFVSVEKFWNDKSDQWRLELEANGYPSTVNIYYKRGDEKEMLRVFDLLFKWVFNL